MAKRNQLEVGQQWAFSSSRGHDISKYGLYDMATIVSVEPHEQARYSSRISKVSGGNGVLVSIIYRYQGIESIRQKVIQLSELFMLWSEFVPAMEAEKIRQKAAWEARQVREAEQRKFNAEVYAPALREFLDAIQTINGQYVGSYKRIDQLPIEVLQAITNALKVNA